ncbi:LOW QUALITY PROTEIN: uncharacterized protein [Amphiura filiformis]|uniref:LOW QUALITY PROTEIN: uncharacterized protein n=1 Tax=Amphiura filiformis TaxID=82378 RepID=UPI003B20BA6D
MKFQHFVVFMFICGSPTATALLELPGLFDWAAQFSQSLGLGNHGDVTQELDQQIQQLLEGFKKSAEKIFEETLEHTEGIYKLNKIDQASERHRRSTTDKDGDGTSDEFEDIYHLLSVDPITRLDVTTSRDVETFVLDDSLYFATLNGSTNETQNEVKIFVWDNTSPTNLTLIQTLETEDVYDIAPINIAGVMYLAVAESNSDSDLFTGTVVYKFDPTLQQFEHVQRLWTTGARQVTSVEIEGDPCLVIGAAYSTVDSNGLSQEMSAAYLWLGAHFDRFASFPTHGVRDIHAFTIHQRKYLAIANYEDNNGNVNINSEILVYDSHLHDLEHFQFIETKGARDWEYFGSGAVSSRAFLAVVNNPNSDEQHTSMIYKYFDGRFVPFQCIDTIGAERWHAVTNEDNHLVLLALATVNGVQFYEYDGWWFKLTDNQYSGDSLGGSSFGFVSLLWDDKYLFGVAEGYNAGHNIFELTFQEYSPLEERHEEVAAICVTNTERFGNLTHDQEVMRNETSNLVYINSEEPQIITGDITLTTNVTVEDIVVDKVYVTLGMVLDDAGLAQLADIRSLYANNTSELGDLEDSWNRTLKIHSDQTVSGEKEFKSIMVSSDLTVESLTVESGFISGNISVEDLDNNTARTDRIQTFTEHITFADQVNMLSNLYVSGELDNGIDTSHLVTLSRNHTITAQKSFQDSIDITGNLDVEGTIDGINISPETIMLSYGDQTFTGDLTFNVQLDYEADVNIDGLVDGVNLVDLEDRVVLTTGVQTITGDKTFLGPVTMDAGMISNDYLIDGVDIVSLNETSVRISMEQEITGMLNFSQDLSILGNLKVDGSIDGLNVPDDVVHINEGDTVTLYGTLEFNNNVTFTTIWCSDEIDGISCQDGTGLDILLTSGNQVVFGHSIFMDDIWLDGVSDVTGLIDGIDVPALSADTVYDTGSQTISGNKVFSNSITVQDNIVVDNLIQDVNLTELDIRAIKLSDGFLQADAELVFDGPVTFVQAVVTNGNHNFGDLTLSDLVSQGPAEDIRGNKVFSTDVVSEDYFNVTGHVNDISLQELYRDAINTTDVSPRQLPGNFTFLNNVTIATNLNVDGLVDGVNVSNIVKMTGNQEIFGETTFDNDLVVDTLVVDGNLLIQDYINEITMSDIINDTLIDMDCIGALGMQSGHVTDDQITASDYYAGFEPEKARLHNPMNNWVSAVADPTDPWIQVDFGHDVAITGLQTQGSATAGHYFEWVEMLQIQYGETNDSLAYIMDGAAAKTFVANSDRDTVVDIKFPELISTRILRIRPTQWEGWTALRFEVIGCDDHHGNQVVTGTKTFQNGLTFGDDITTDGLVDGVDITHMAADGVYKTGDHIITAKKTFDIQTNLQEMEVTGTVCGVDTDSLYTRSLQQNMDQTITGNYTFLSNVDMNGNLTVNGNITGYQFEFEVAHMVLITDTVIDVNEIYFDNVTSEGNVDVDGDIDSIDVGAEAIHTNVPNQVITGKKTFTYTLSLSANVEPGAVCTVDIGDLSDTTVYKTTEQTITGHKIFEDEMVLQQDLHVDGLVDGVNLTHTDINVMRNEDSSNLEQRALFSADIENVHVLDVVYYNGTLDGVDLIQLNQTYLSLTRDQNISASKTFEGTVQIASNGSLNGDDITLDGDGFINDIDLEDFVAAALMSGVIGQTVNGVKTFGTNLTIEDFVAGALMSGVIGQTVNGVKTFGTNLTIEGDVQVDGLLDNIDISGNMMRTDKASTVTGSKRFIGGLMEVDENILMGDDILVDGVDLSEWEKYSTFIINDFVINSSVSIGEVNLEQDLIVNGLIDDINLNLASVLATIENQTVTGHKTFSSNVISQRDLDLVGYINSIDVQELLSDTLLMSRPQSIDGTYTILQKAIFGNLFSLALINGVNMPDFYDQIYTYPNFETLNASLDQNYELLGDIVDVQENVEAIFQHIASLQDVVTIGLGQWHGVEYDGSNYLIEAKETEVSSDGCVDSRIYKWNETVQNYELETTLEPIMATAVDTFIDDGRLFMVVSSLTDDSGSSCFTNKWTLAPDSQPQASLPGAYAGSVLATILVKDSVSSDWYVFQHLPCIYPTDVEVFVNPQTQDQCIAITNVRTASYNSRLNVYIYCGDSSVGFTFWKAVPSVGGVKVKHFFVDNELHLALANQVDSRSGSFSTKSTLWKLQQSGEFDKVAQVTTSAANDVIMMEMEGRFYVIYANEFQGDYFNQDFNVPVQVYEYVPDGSPRLQWIQDISADGTKSLGQFVIQSQNYLLVLDRQSRVMVYMFNGIRLFEYVLTIPVIGGEHLEVLNLADLQHLQIAVMSYKQTPVLFPGQPTGPAEIDSPILEIVQQGRVIPALGGDQCYRD